MHLFKNFFKLLSRNRTGLIIYGIITIVMAALLILTATAQKNNVGVTVEAKSYDISYVDDDNSKLSQGLIDYLSEKNNVSDYSDKTETEISNIVFFGITSYHFTIPAGFSEDIESGDDSNGITFETANGNNGFASFDIDAQINNYLNTYRNYRSLGLSEDEAITKTKELLVNESEITVVANDEESVTASEKEIVLFNINQYFPYLILGLLTLGVGHTVIITNRKELLDRNTVSPVPSYMTKFVNVCGLVTSGFIFWGILMAFNFIYGAGTEIINNYGWIIAVNSLLCMLTCCSIAALLTNLIKTSNTLGMVTNIVSLSMAFFCGVFVPMRFIGDKVLAFSKFLPYYWTVNVNNMTSEVMSKYAFDMHQVWTSFAVELLFAVVIAAIAIIGTSKRIIKA